MTDPDLDRLSQMWREEPDPEMMTGLRRSAAKVARRARLAHIADAGGAIAVSVLVLLLVYYNPDTSTVINGAGAIFIMWYSHFRQRRLRAVEMRRLAGTTEEMLIQSVAKAQAIRKRAWIGLALMPVFLVIGLLFGSALIEAGGAMLPTPERSLAADILVMGAGLALLAGIAVHFVRAIDRSQEQIHRLGAMLDTYQQEKESAAGQ